MERLIRRIRAFLIEIEIKRSVKRIQREIGLSPDSSKAQVEGISRVSAHFSFAK